MQVIDDADSIQGVHPITGPEVEDNPFDTQSKYSEYDFEEDIYLVGNPKNEDRKIFSRAMIDTGMERNAIHHEKAQMTGLPLAKWTEGELRDADGEPFTPEGLITATFHFYGQYQSNRSWKVEFMVLHDPPFDVALGKKFINSARLFKKSDVLLPIVVPKSKDKVAQEASNREAKMKSDTKKREEEERRKAQRQKDKEARRPR